MDFSALRTQVTELLQHEVAYLALADNGPSTSLQLSEWYESAEHQPSHPVFWGLLQPWRPIASTPILSCLTIVTPPPLYTACGCGHGGTRNISTSCSVHTWSVNPAAIAGVHSRHNFAEPLPLVVSETRNGWRKLVCGRTKLW